MAKRKSVQKVVPEPRSQHQDDSLEFVAVVKQSPLGVVASQQAKQDTFADLGGRVVNPPLDPERLLMLYEENAVHAACINAKAVDAAGQGWLLEGEELPDEDADDLDELGEETDPSAELDKAQANLATTLEKITPDLTFDELLEQAAREQEMIGWGIWEVVRDPNAPLPTSDNAKLGDIVGLFPFPAHTFRNTKNQETYLQVRGGKRVWFKPFGSRKNIDSASGAEIPKEDLDRAREAGRIANELIVFKTYSPRSPWYGVPRWISGIPTIAELTAIREYNISWHSSGGTSDRSVHVTAKNKGTAKAVAQEIQTRLNEARGQGHVTLVTSGSEDVKVEIQEFTKGQTGKRDGQFKNRREELTKELLMAHQTPPYRVGWAEIGSLGGSAAKEMLRAYREGAVEPLQVVMASRLNQTLFGPDGLNLIGYTFKLEELGWDMSEQEQARAYEGVKNGVLSPNDALEEIGMERKEDRPELDRHYINGQPIDELGGEEPTDEQDLMDRFAEALRISTEQEEEPVEPEEEEAAL